MKIHKQPVFSPITITLETEEEYKVLINLFRNSQVYSSGITTYYMKDTRTTTERLMHEKLESEYNKTF